MCDLSLDLAQPHLTSLVTGCEPSLFQAKQVRNRSAQIANSHDVFPIWLAGNAQSSRLLTGSLLTEQIESLNYQHCLSTFQNTCASVLPRSVARLRDSLNCRLHNLVDSLLRFRPLRPTSSGVFSSYLFCHSRSDPGRSLRRGRPSINSIPDDHRWRPVGAVEENQAVS